MISELRYSVTENPYLHSPFMIHETTNRFAGLEEFYLALFDAMPGNSYLLQNDAPRYTILAATSQILKYSGKKKEDLVGKGLFEAFPSNPQDKNDTGEGNLRSSLAHVIRHKESHQLPEFRYDVNDGNGLFIERYWKTENIPVFAPDGEVAYLIHNTEDITDQVKVEKKLASLKGFEKAYDFFMSAPVIVGFIRGDDYVIELANEGLLEVWGRGSEVIGQPLFEAIPELTQQGFKALLDHVRITGESFSANEYPITLTRHGKEEVLYFDFIYKPFYADDKETKASGIISVGHDVTMQVLAKRKIEESEAKYRNLFESMDQGFCVVEMIFDSSTQPVDYRFLETNPVFETQTGLKDAVGKTARELIPNLESHWLEVYGKVALTGQSTRFTEGSEALGRWFDVYAYKTGDVESHRVALLFTDISERRKADEALKHSESNLRNMILQAPVAMCIFRGKEYVVEIAHDSMLEIWGKTREQVIGKPTFESNPEGKGQGFEEILETIYRTGNPFRLVEMPLTLLRHGKKELFYTNLSYNPIKEPDGTVSGILVVGNEVTEQVLARQKIEEVVTERTRELGMANEELKRSNQNLEEFAYAASHDLKEPMRKVQLFSDRLKDRLKDTLAEEDKGLFERIIHATHRMNTLIDDLLMYSHVSRGAIIEETVDLNQKLKAVLEDLELEIEEKKAKVIADPLPTIKGHRRQLQQLFQNLVSNAVKYNRPGVVPEIRITCKKVEDADQLPFIPAKQKEQYCLINVQDNGIGFHQEDAERIFNVFTRLHGNAEYKGSGVGLSIVRKVVENHGGYIWAESTSGEGATFHVLLPVE